MQRNHTLSMGVGMRRVLPAVALWLASCLLTISTARAETLRAVGRAAGPEPESKVARFPFEVTQADTRLNLSAEVDLSEGTWKLRVLDAKGKTITWMSCGGRLRLPDKALGYFGEEGEGSLEVTTTGAVGTWHVTLSGEPPPVSKASPVLLLLPGVLMILVGVASVLWWKERSRTLWRWFLAGAGIWTVGVALKFLCAYLLNTPVLAGLKASLPHAGYIVARSVYIGLLTGVFEIGMTLCAGLIWRSMAREPKRAVAVGVGAGAFEAVLVGLASLVGTLVVLGRGSETLAAQMAHMASTTAVFWLTGPVERAIAILCHTSSRALVLLSVATRRWTFFWYGFAIMTAVDAIAGAAYLSGAVGRYSSWWIELAIAPFALVSLPAIAWCLRHWPRQPRPAAKQAGVTAT